MNYVPPCLLLVHGNAGDWVMCDLVGCYAVTKILSQAMPRASLATKLGTGR
jgi:hypothetical protein